MSQPTDEDKAFEEAVALGNKAIHRHMTDLERENFAESKRADKAKKRRHKKPPPRDPVMTQALIDAKLLPKVFAY